MNESGRSVQPATQFFHVAPRDMIVLHDELDLAFADVRVKLGAATPGTTGCVLSCSTLGTPDFVRVRMGVGRPAGRFAAKLPTTFCRLYRSRARHRSRHRRQGAAATLKVLTEGVERAMRRSEHAAPSVRAAKAAREPAAPSPEAPPAKKARAKISPRGFASRDEPFGMVPGGFLAPGHKSWGPFVHKETASHGNSSRGAKSAPENTKPSMS